MSTGKAIVNKIFTNGKYSRQWKAQKEVNKELLSCCPFATALQVAGEKFFERKIK